MHALRGSQRFRSTDRLVDLGRAGGHGLVGCCTKSGLAELLIFHAFPRPFLLSGDGGRRRGKALLHPAVERHERSPVIGEIARLEGDRQFAGGHRGETTGSNPRTAPSCKMRHDLRRHKLMGLHVVAIVAVDQQLYTGVLVLADQIDGLRHGADKAP
jgi:hypothetical protein